jgi:hypothetical protein
MKDLLRIACVLLAGLLAACGGGRESPGAGGAAAPAADTRLELDAMAWDQGDWAP